MKIVQILPEMNSGGVELCTLELASQLVTHGHESLVISNGGRLVPELEATGARHVTRPVHRKNPVTLGQVFPLRRLLVQEQPHILHIHSRVPGWIAWLAWRGMNPATRPALVSTMHGFYSVNAYSAIMAQGERVIAVSRSIRDHVLKCYPKTPPSNIRIVSHGIDPQMHHPDFQPPLEWLARWRADYPAFVGKRILLLPGRITRLKGHQDFFRLIANLLEKGEPVHGVIAGEAHESKQAYLDELRTLIHSLGLDSNITFLGHRSDIREIMAVSDITCALSQQPESFGRTVLEALALGKPVVGYDCGGVGELLESLFPQGKVPVGNHAKLLEITQSVIRNSPVPAPVGDPFTQSAMCRNTFAVYQELLKAERCNRHEGSQDATQSKTLGA